MVAHPVCSSGSSEATLAGGPIAAAKNLSPPWNQSTAAGFVVSFTACRTMATQGQAVRVREGVWNKVPPSNCNIYLNRLGEADLVASGRLWGES